MFINAAMALNKFVTYSGNSFHVWVHDAVTSLGCKGLNDFFLNIFWMAEYKIFIHGVVTVGMAITPECWVDTNPGAISGALEILFICASFTSRSWYLAWGVTIMGIKVFIRVNGRWGLLINPFFNVATNFHVSYAARIGANKTLECIFILLRGAARFDLKYAVWLVTATVLQNSFVQLYAGFMINEGPNLRVSTCHVYELIICIKPAL